MGFVPSEPVLSDFTGFKGVCADFELVETETLPPEFCFSAEQAVRLSARTAEIIHRIFLKVIYSFCVNNSSYPFGDVKVNIHAPSVAEV